MKIQSLLRIPFALFGIVPTQLLVVATLICATTGVFLMGEWYDGERTDLAAYWAQAGEDEEDSLDADDDFEAPDDEIGFFYVAPEAWNIDEARHHERVALAPKDYNNNSYREAYSNSFRPHRFCETQDW